MIRTFLPKEPLQIPHREVLRYAGMNGTKDCETAERVRTVSDDCAAACRPKCVYRFADIQHIGSNEVSLADGLTLTGKLAAKYLADCDKAIVVLATVGQGVDRMIAAQSVRSALNGLLADAAGSAAVEALLDAFCGFLQPQMSIKPRISPGYGDFALDNQRAILPYLFADRNLGVYLNDSLLMSPAKSVTALIGVRKDNNV